VIILEISLFSAGGLETQQQENASSPFVMGSHGVPLLG
jgi:hypothetical protein